MVQFSNPTYAGVMIDDPNPVTLGPFTEARLSEDCLYGDYKVGSDALGYFDRDESLWIRDGKRYSDVKIFASPDVVSA